MVGRFVTNPVPIALTLGNVSQCAAAVLNEAELSQWIFSSAQNAQFQCLGVTKLDLGFQRMYLNQNNSNTAFVTILPAAQGQIDPGSLAIVQVDANMQPIGAPLCVPKDDGNTAIDGDRASGDNIFSCNFDFQPTSGGVLNFVVQGTIVGARALSGGIHVVATPALQSSDFQKIAQLQGDSASAWNNALTQFGSTDQAVQATVTTISQMQGVAAVTLGADSRSIFVVDSYGLTTIIPLNNGPTATNGGAATNDGGGATNGAATLGVSAKFDTPKWIPIPPEHLIPMHPVSNDQCCLLGTV